MAREERGRGEMQTESEGEALFKRRERGEERRINNNITVEK